MSASTDTINAFLQAASYAGVVLESPAVGEAWTRDSALPQMSVGAIGGHLFLIMRRVDKHLDEPEPLASATGTSQGYRWLRVERPDDLDRDEHAVVRADGEHVATWGWPSVDAAYKARLTKVSTRLSTQCPASVALESGVMDFQAYLATRVVELLVHADDMAVSVDLAPSELPVDAATVAIELLVHAARSIHGDIEVLRSLTRAERVRPPAPSVY